MKTGQQMHNVLTSVMKSYISQVSLTAFKNFTEFFIPLVILQTFQGRKISILNSLTLQTSQDLYETMWSWCTLCFCRKLSFLKSIP